MNVIGKKALDEGFEFKIRKSSTLRFLALGWHLKEIHMTWAPLEKKRMRLRTYTKVHQELCSQSVETASQALSDAVGKNAPAFILISLRDQARNWLERLPAGSITTWEDLTTRFLAQFFPPERTAKLCNDILIFQQHHGESLSEAWTRFKDLLQKVPHHGIDLWLQV
ncbi:zinc finger, CCHC-type containing protein [Tanacetum coccineum]